MDNTLCDCTPYYVEALDQFVEYTHARTKTHIPKDVILGIVKNIDAQCTKLDMGFNRTRFPRSFEAASLTVDIIGGNELDLEAAEHSYFIADQVFSKPYPLYDGIWEMLMNYTSNPNINLFLYTLGDFSVQRRKIDINQLDTIFPADHIYIVDKKDSNALGRIVTDHELVPSETFVIGDSLKGEIGPANKLGLTSIWVQHHVNVEWKYEDETHVPTYTIEETTDLPNIISFRR